MKKVFLKIGILLGLSACSPPNKVQGFDQTSYNVLLQESRGWPQYIFLKKDTAYYEIRQFAKASYFTDFDTLIRQKDCDCYLGKKNSLQLDEKQMTLKKVTGRDAGKQMYLAFATPKQLQSWNSYRNEDTWRKFSKKYDSLLEVNSSNAQLYHRIKEDWKQLLGSTDSLDQTTFKNQLDDFKAKYSVK